VKRPPVQFVTRSLNQVPVLEQQGPQHRVHGPNALSRQAPILFATGGSQVK